MEKEIRNAIFDAAIEQALVVLKSGSTILYPTDTIWGIGCDATHSKAVDQIYKLKNRPDAKSMIILVADERTILQYVAAPDPAVFDFIQTQVKPTTIIFDGAIGLPENLVAADGSVAIRLVQDPFCRHLLRRLRKPLVSTSANISGQPAPQNFSQVSEVIKKGVDHVVQWRQDDTTASQPSQIIRWNNGQSPTIIRP